MIGRSLLLAPRFLLLLAGPFVPINGTRQLQLRSLGYLTLLLSKVQVSARVLPAPERDQAFEPPFEIASDLGSKNGTVDTFQPRAGHTISPLPRL